MSSTQASPATNSQVPLEVRRSLASRIFAWLIWIAAIGGGLWWWRAHPPTTSASAMPAAMRGNRAVTVVTAKATTSDVEDWLSVLGTVTPLNTVVIRSRVDGQLLKLNFKEGDIVKEGTLLAEIDPRPFEVQLAQAKGQLDRDQALLENAKRDLDRYNALLAKDSIAKQQVDTQLSLVRQYEGTIAADQSQVDNAKLSLDYCRITAPISGRLGIRFVDPGNMIHASDANGIISITQLQPIGVIFSIPQERAPAVLKLLKTGATVRVVIISREENRKLADGRLLTTDNQIDLATGTLKLKAECPNADDALFPNQFVTVRLLVETRKAQVVIPSNAVQRGSQGALAYVVNEDQTVSIHPLKLGVLDGDKQSVIEGLKDGDVVVTEGTDKLREGATVQTADSGKGGEKRGGPPGGKPESGKADGEKRGKGKPKDAPKS